MSQEIPLCMMLHRIHLVLSTMKHKAVDYTFLNLCQFISRRRSFPCYSMHSCPKSIGTNVVSLVLLRHLAIFSVVPNAEFQSFLTFFLHGYLFYHQLFCNFPVQVSVSRPLIANGSQQVWCTFLLRHVGLPHSIKIQFSLPKSRPRQFNSFCYFCNLIFVCKFSRCPK